MNYIEIAANQILVDAPHLTIEYDEVNEWIYVNWIGDQTVATAKDGCEKIVKAVMQKRCTKVLNDNSDVNNDWIEVAEWLAKNWFPRLYIAGCFYFAWVYSPSLECRLSIEETLRFLNVPTKTLIFEDQEIAGNWLNDMV